MVKRHERHLFPRSLTDNLLILTQVVAMVIFLGNMVLGQIV